MIVYAPDSAIAERGFERLNAAASVPGVEGEVCAAVSGDGYGHVFGTGGGVAPGLVSVPGRGVLLSCEVTSEDFARRLGVAGHQVEKEVARRFGGATYGMPRANAAFVRRVCEFGAEALASEGVIEEEDLAFLTHVPGGDPEAAGRRALLSGEREWGERFATATPYFISEVFDSEALERAGLEPSRLVFGFGVPAVEMGRVAHSLHRERIISRISYGEFDFVGDPSGDGGIAVAPPDTEEARDFVAASGAASNFSDALVALSLFVVRRALGGVVGDVVPVSSWRVGGVEESVDGGIIHRDGVAAVGEGSLVLSGGVFASGMGTMAKSAPTFGAGEDEGRWLWEEAGLLGRIATFEVFG